jgi:hypothetical protein
MSRIAPSVNKRGIGAATRAGRVDAGSLMDFSGLGRCVARLDRP